MEMMHFTPILPGDPILELAMLPSLLTLQEIQILPPEPERCFGIQRGIRTQLWELMRFGIIQQPLAIRQMVLNPFTQILREVRMLRLDLVHLETILLVLLMLLMDISPFITTALVIKTPPVVMEHFIPIPPDIPILLMA